MKRCSLFSLAFVTTLLLGVIPGSFENSRGTIYKVDDAREAMNATWEEQVNHSGKDHLPVSGSDISKKPKQ